MAGWPGGKLAIRELRHHVPFTLLGAALGVAFMVAFRNVEHETAHTLFAVFHPAHVILSAMVTAALFRIHRPKTRWWVVVLVGYLGSIGIATLSDSVIPHVGERLLGLDIPPHCAMHSLPGEDSAHHAPHEHDHAEGHICTGDHDHHGHEGTHLHLGFIEEWYLVNPAAAMGLAIAFIFPITRFPHALHVLVSTWASSSYLLMRLAGPPDWAVVGQMFVILFLAVWLPCCVSDIVFPSLIAGRHVGHLAENSHDH